MGQSSDDCMVEGDHRRPGWTNGLPVRLSDGLPWRLPRIDLTLFLTIPGLKDDIVDVMRIASVAQGRPRASPTDPDAIFRYHGSMTNLGGRLLRANYEMPDLDWSRLLRFAECRMLLIFGYDVAYAMTAAHAHWQPFVGSFDPEAQAALTLN